MPTRTLNERAEARGVSLEQLAAVLQPVASAHFGPRVTLEVSVNPERKRVELMAVLRVEQIAQGSAMSLASAHAHIGPEVQPGDELMFQVFYTPDDDLEMDAQDDQYAIASGISNACSGFWPVARRAMAPLLGLEDDPMEEVLQRALLFSVTREGKFVLRRGPRDALFLKERIVVGQGEIAAGHFGRRDLVDGVEVEVIRREVPVAEVISGLFDTDAIPRACDGSGVTTAQLIAGLAARDVHLSRRTAFRTGVDRLVGEAKPGLLARFAQLVSSEREARFIP